MFYNKIPPFLWHLLRGTVKSLPFAGSLLEQLIYGPIDSKERAEETNKLYNSLQKLQGQLKTLEEIALDVKSKLTLSEEGYEKLELLTSSISSAKGEKVENISPEIMQAYFASLERIPLNAYLSDISEELKVWRGLSMHIPISIEDIYIPTTLSVASQNEHQFIEVGDNIDDLFSKHICTDNLLIKGPPGSGKSTLLRHLGLILVERFNNLSSKIVPIFLHLPTVEMLCETEHNWNLSIPDIIKERGSAHGDEKFLEALHKSVVDIIKSGNAVILLDAADEVSEEKHSQMKTWIDSICSSAKQCQIVLTSRTIPFIHGLHSFYTYDVEPFSRNKQNCFIKRWFNSFNRISHADEMIKYLEHPEMITVRDSSVLSGNPLFLTMMCIEYMLNNKVSRTPGELIEHFTQILLEDWDLQRAIRRIKHKTGLDIKRRVLEDIASYYFEANEAVFYFDSLINIVRSVIKEFGTSQSQDPQMLLTEIEVASGLLIKDWYGKWKFSHFLYQEFFAARYRWRHQIEGEGQSKWLENIFFEGRYENVKNFYTQLMQSGRSV
jgi:predicted NACHT family NTPase